MARKRPLFFRSVNAAVKRSLNCRWRKLRWMIVSLLTVGGLLLGWPSFASRPSNLPQLVPQSTFPICSKFPSIGNLGSQPACLATAESNSSQPTEPQQLVDLSKTFYESGQLDQAILHLQQAIQIYQTQGDDLGAAIALRNLALVYQQLGDWAAAQATMNLSLELLNQQTPAPVEALAQTLELKGELELTAGEPEAALTTWERATTLYAQLNDLMGIGRTTIQQAEALQTLGLYQRATGRLTQLLPQLQAQPDSLMLSAAFRSLGDALRLSGQFEAALDALQQSLDIAQRLNNPEAQTATLISLGNLDAVQNNYLDARIRYQQALDQATTPLSRMQAQLNLADAAFADGLLNQTRPLLDEIAANLDQLPLSRASLYADLNFVDQQLKLIRREAEPNPPAPAAVLPMAQRLATIQQQAQQLGDRKAESFALGQLGELYEQAQQWSEAQRLTEAALNLSEQINADEVSYRWEWQLGRILKAQGQLTRAITAYTNAISTLQLLRSDLVGINADLQISFRNNAEPIHRELVSLLLNHEPDGSPSPQNLEQARQTIESLQLAELENFFRAACLNAQPVQLDQLDRQAAVLYPIVLPDRLEVILSLPQQPLRHWTTAVTQQDVINTVSELQNQLQQPPTANSANSAATNIAELEAAVYNWLIRPIRPDLDDSAVKTIVFVLDGALRNIPMTVLYDGQQYLIESYSIALAPGLQLLPSENRQRQQLDVLMLGLSEERPGFSELPDVPQEISRIQAAIGNRGEELLNENFTLPRLEAALNRKPVPIVHLATHAQAGGNLESTFILTWDGKLQVNQLSALLQSANLSRRRPIDLLVLSACQTAVGDDRATLGLAGITVRAGARSTIATLWSVSDAAMAQLMGQLYEQLAQSSITKAEALRRAQLALLKNPDYQHPFYWSPVILLGNWA